MGWIIPSSLIDKLSSLNDSSLKFVLGCKGFVFILDTGKLIILPMILLSFFSEIDFAKSFGSFNNAESPLPRACFLFDFPIVYFF